MDMWIVLLPCLLWIVLQWAWQCRHLWNILISFSLDIYQVLKFMNSLVILFLTSKEFSYGYDNANLYSFQLNKAFFSPYCSIFFLWLVPLVSVALTRVMGWLIKVWIFLSLVTSYYAYFTRLHAGSLDVFFWEISSRPIAQFSFPLFSLWTWSLFRIWVSGFSFIFHILYSILHFAKHTHCKSYLPFCWLSFSSMD